MAGACSPRSSNVWSRYMGHWQPIKHIGFKPSPLVVGEVCDALPVSLKFEWGGRVLIKVEGALVNTLQGSRRIG